jgi:hypothetical protein
MLEGLEGVKAETAERGDAADVGTEVDSVRSVLSEEVCDTEEAYASRNHVAHD